MMKLLHRKTGTNISVNLYGGGAMQKHLTLVLGSVLMACLATIALSFTKVEASVCQANAQPVRVPVSVPATDSNGNPTNIANFVNTRSPYATRQAFQLPPGRYPVNALIILRAGDALSGAPLRYTEDGWTGYRPRPHHEARKRSRPREPYRPEG